MTTPAHWRGRSFSPIQPETTIAVTSGWQAMMSAVTPADIPRYCA